MNKLITLCLTWDEFRPLLTNDEPMIGCDTETNYSGIKDDYSRDIRDGRGHAIGISLSVRRGGVLFKCYLPFRHEAKEGLNYDVGENFGKDILITVKEFLEAYTGYLVFHNAKFDLVSLSTLGINYTGLFYCTLEICHLINEIIPYSKDLTSCVKKYVGPEEAKEDDENFKVLVRTFGWAGVPIKDMTIYASHDAALALALMESIMELFKQEVPAEYWQHKQDFTRVMIALEKPGIRIDVPLCERMTAIGKSTMESLCETVGGNLGSPVFLKEVLIDRLGLPVVKTSQKTGKPSFDKDAMEEYDILLERSTDPTAQYVLEYRGWQKAVTSNYLPYVRLLSPDGRLRPNYKLHGTKTGRSSCEKPNLQQIPRVTDKQWNGRMKDCFIPEDGYGLFEADYAQLELRLGAAYGQEEGLVQVFEEGRDVFTEMSGRIGLPRQNTKTLVYSIQYGAGIPRISRALGISPDKARDIRQDYKDAYPGLVKVSNLASSVCRSKRKVQIWSGRYRHFQYPKDEGHKAFNSVIQGGAADIVEHVMVRLHREINNNDCRMLLTVHDSVVFEIRLDKLDSYRQRILNIMQDVRPDFGVRFAVDFHKWGE